MKFITKTLTLYTDLLFSMNESETSVQNEYLWKYRCGVKHNDINPKRELFLLDGQFMGNALKQNIAEQKYSVIPQGKYLFLQGIITNKNTDNHNLFLQASEELYLESLWLDKKITSDVVFLRFLEEDGKTVFQIFREIENT